MYRDTKWFNNRSHFSVHFNNKLIRHVDECRINGRIIKGFRVPATNVHFSFVRRALVVVAIGKRYRHFRSFCNRIHFSIFVTSHYATYIRIWIKVYHYKILQYRFGYKVM